MRILVCVCLLLLAMCTWGHDLSLTRIEIARDGTPPSVRVVTPLSKLVQIERLGGQPSASQIDMAVRRRLSLWLDDTRFEAASVFLDLDTENDMLTWAAKLPEGDGPLAVRSLFYPEDAASKTVVSLGPGHEVVLDAERNSWIAGPSPTLLQTTGSYVLLGVKHILSGLDHVLFVLGLVLLGGGVKSLLKTVTAFTLAHSITLSLAATGTVHPNPRIVEPLIALSIVAVAVENLRRVKPQSAQADYRPWIAFAFGLVHGFGLADALSGVGLRGWSLATALLSFNVGVELGQAGVLLVGLGALSVLATKWPDVHPKLVGFLSTAIGVVGSYWCVSRILAG